VQFEEEIRAKERQGRSHGMGLHRKKEKENTVSNLTLSGIELSGGKKFSVSSFSLVLSAGSSILVFVVLLY
jgi:hypothetical protein